MHRNHPHRKSTRQDPPGAQQALLLSIHMRKPTSITPAGLRDVSEHMGHRLLGSQLPKEPLAGQTSQSPNPPCGSLGRTSPKSWAMTRMTRPETHQNLIYSSKEHAPGLKPGANSATAPAPVGGARQC